jgi:hypothetical protein
MRSMPGCWRSRCRRALPALILALAGCGGGSPPAVSAGPDAQASAGLAQLREATRPFENFDAAVAAGYARDVPNCLVHEHHGAMGYHHVNRGYLTTDLSAGRPQILLYERLPDGRYRLNGVEFIVPYRIWPRDSVAPVLMGQTLKHEDNLKLWFLHVWAWLPNPDGVFADFHPDVRCSEASRKVFMPYEVP